MSLRTEDGFGQALHLTHAGAGPLRLGRVRDAGDALGASFRMVRSGCVAGGSDSSAGHTQHSTMVTLPHRAEAPRPGRPHDSMQAGPHGSRARAQTRAGHRRLREWKAS